MTTRHLRGSDDLAHDRRKRPMASDILAVSRRAGLSDRPTEKIGEPWLLILLLQRPTDGLPGDLAFQAQDLSEMTMPRFNSCSFTGRRDDHEISPSCSLVCTVAVSLPLFFLIAVSLPLFF